MAMKKPKSSTTRTAGRTSNRKAKAGGTVRAKARTKASKKGSKKARKKASKKARAPRTRQADAPSVPAFLTTRQFKKLAETTRRQRISQARTAKAVVPAAGGPRAAAAKRTAARPKVWDYSVGFDPQDDD